MTKKILIISASPRKGGNSDLLCNEFMRGAEEAGNDVEKIFLSEMNINYCTGCCSCIGGSGKCSQNDDMTKIMQLVLDAEIIVLGTPVYFHAMNAQMKAFIDRICPIYSLVRNKDFYYIIASAGGGSETKTAAQSLDLFTSCLPGSKIKATISATGIWDTGGVKNTSALKEAYNTGRNIA